MALGKELEKVLLSQQHLLQVLVVVQTQVPEMELKQEQELQVWQVQEVILVKCVLADCSYSSSRSRIAVCVPVPKIQKQMVFAQSRNTRQAVIQSYLFQRFAVQAIWLDL